MFAIVVGPPMWWGLLCTCTLCTLVNPAVLESAVLEGLGHFDPKFRIQGDIPHQPFVHG